MIKIQWLASIWRQNDQKCWVTSQNIQNNAKLQKPIKCNELHRLDVETIKTKLNYKSDQNPMTCIDLPSKRSIMLSLVPKHSKQRKTTKPIKCNELHRLDVKTIKTKLNYKSDQNPMTCIDLTSKRSKMLSYVAKHSKQRKTTKPIKCNELHRYDVRTIKTKLNYKSDLNYKTHQMQWIASIGCENDQNKAKLQKWSKSNDLHRFDLKTINNVEFGLKTFKTKLNYKSGLNYKSDQNPMTCIDLTSKRSKMLSYVANHSKQRKTTKPNKCYELHR